MRLKGMLRCTALAMSPSPLAHADEAIWMPSQQPAIGQQRKAAGHHRDPAVLAGLTRRVLRAVVKEGGATGAFVSDEGLVLTNRADLPTIDACLSINAPSPSS